MSDLTDLEIEAGIADIEKIHYIETKYAKNNFLALVSENDFTGTPPEMIGKYSPLTDDALCFQLMVKYKVTVNFEYGSATIITDEDEFTGGEDLYQSPNKAILLSIIEAPNER